MLLGLATKSAGFAALKLTPITTMDEEWLQLLTCGGKLFTWKKFCSTATHTHKQLLILLTCGGNGKLFHLKYTCYSGVVVDEWILEAKLGGLYFRPAPYVLPGLRSNYGLRLLTCGGKPFSSSYRLRLLTVRSTTCRYKAEALSMPVPTFLGPIGPSNSFCTEHFHGHKN